MTKEEQIKILKQVLVEIENGQLKTGLCYLLNKNIDLTIYDSLKDVIPHFTIENSRKFNSTGTGGAGSYWWPIGEVENRKLFILWMIKRLQEEYWTEKLTGKK